VLSVATPEPEAQPLVVDVTERLSLIHI